MEIRNYYEALGEQYPHAEKKGNKKKTAAREFTIEKDYHPHHGTVYTVTVWTTVDGITYYDCGGRYCKSEEEAQKYIEDYKQGIIHNSEDYKRQPVVVLAYKYREL